MSVRKNVGQSSKVLLVEVESKVLTLGLDEFSQCRGSTVEHMNLPFLLLCHFLEHLRLVDTRERRGHFQCTVVGQDPQACMSPNHDSLQVFPDHLT